MPASNNWKTLWKSRITKVKKGYNTHFIARIYLKEHRNKQRRLFLWLRDIKKNLSFYGTLSLWDFMIDLKKVISKTGRRIRKK